MDMNVSFHHPIASSAEAIWDMEEKNEYTKDVWCQYKYMVDYIDLINYQCACKNFHINKKHSSCQNEMSCVFAWIKYVAQFYNIDKQK